MVSQGLCLSLSPEEAVDAFFTTCWIEWHLIVRFAVIIKADSSFTCKTTSAFTLTPLLDSDDDSKGKTTLNLIHPTVG